MEVKPTYPVKIKHHPQFSLILFVAAMVAVVICIFFYNVGNLIGIALVLGLPTAVPATLVNAWRFSKSTVITEETITIKRFGAIILKQYKMEDRREWREYLNYQGLLVKVFILRVKLQDEYLEFKSDEIWNYEEVKTALTYNLPLPKFEAHTYTILKKTYPKPIYWISIGTYLSLACIILFTPPHPIITPFGLFLGGIVGYIGIQVAPDQ